MLETLEGVPLPAGLQGPGSVAAAGSALVLPAGRLLRLAASASRRAALSSRQELYPRGMSALQALRQSLGALVGVRELRPVDLQARVRGRYPEAAALPERPALDRLLEEAGAPLHWDATAAGHDGAYCSALLGRGATAGLTTAFSRLPTRLSHGAAALDDTLLADAAEVEARLQRSRRQGGLLVLTAAPRLAQRAEAELLRRFGGAAPGDLQRLSVDALLLAALKAQAAAARVDWSVVLRADAAEPTTRDWLNLQRLVQRTLPGLRAALLDSPGPRLVVNVGLLARYGLMGLVTELEQAAGRPGRTPGAWLLLPTMRTGLPMVDGQPVPLVNHLQHGHTVALPQAWIENQHRAATPI